MYQAPFRSDIIGICRADGAEVLNQHSAIRARHSALWTLDFGLWTLDFGLWTLDWTLDFGHLTPPSAFISH
jgi:hypothetical protein